jgi:hypothetical protein
MCRICNESPTGEMETCPDCGRFICFDQPPPGDDTVRTAAVTSGGDLYCLLCAIEHERIETAGDDDDPEEIGELTDWTEDDDQHDD